MSSGGANEHKTWRDKYYHALDRMIDLCRIGFAKEEELEEKLRIKDEQLKAQTAELVAQQRQGVGVMLATITCSCGNLRGITLMHKCLYCNQWYCTLCAERHFGKTIKKYNEEKLK